MINGVLDTIETIEKKYKIDVDAIDKVEDIYKVLKQ